MVKRIAIGGSSANPPHIGHKVLIKKILDSKKFDELIWIPSGNRLDKNDLIDPNHRVAMTMLTFPRNWFFKKHTVFCINFQDVYDFNQHSIQWLIKIRENNPKADLVWFTGVDSVVPQNRFGGKCEIEAAWFNGDILMKKWKFLIVSREKYPRPSTLELPSQFEIMDVKVPDISSTELREKIGEGKAFEHMVTPAVANYIKRFGLYGWKERQR